MFAKQFKELIDKRGLTQRAVAERINTTETTISRYVSGDRTPNIETAVELASVLGVTLDVLVGVRKAQKSLLATSVTVVL